MNMDGYFEFEGKKVGYIINNESVKVSRHGHTDWMSRGITFYDNNEKAIGYRAVYHKADEVTVFTDTAKKWYEEFIAGDIK